MEDDNTPTGVPETPAGASPDALPVDTQPTPAVDQNPSDEPAQPTPQGGQDDDGGDQPTPSNDPLPNVDEKLANFAKANGIEDVSELSERELKILKVARDNQVEKRQELANEAALEKATKIESQDLPVTATPEQQENVRLRNLEMRLEASAWIRNNPEKARYEGAMGKILVDDPNKRLMLADGYLNYDDLYAMAKGSTDDSATVKSQGAQDALRSLAAKQQAAAPAGNATAPTTPKKKRPEDMSIKEMEQTYGFARQ